jgi:predicted Zn-dependent protease
VDIRQPAYWLLESNNPDSITVLAICDFHAYSDGLNFVFGKAHLGGRVTAIYLPRLEMKFMFANRIIKTTIYLNTE